MILHRALLSIFPLAFAVPATAASYVEPVEIDRAVAAFTGASPGAGGGEMLPVDPRLRLAPCAAPLALSWRGDRHDTVLVQCPDAGSWHIFVAVRAAASGASRRPAVARGEAITLAVTGDGFTVSEGGEALEAGAVGDWVLVAPLREGKPVSEPIRARIVRPGLVTLEVP